VVSPGAWGLVEVGEEEPPPLVAAPPPPAGAPGVDDGVGAGALAGGPADGGGAPPPWPGTEPRPGRAPSGVVVGLEGCREEPSGADCARDLPPCADAGEPAGEPPEPALAAPGGALASSRAFEGAAGVVLAALVLEL
jgi:hypothetical protein